MSCQFNKVYYVLYKSKYNLIASFKRSISSTYSTLHNPAKAEKQEKDRVYTSKKFAFKLDDVVNEGIESGDFKAKIHPGTFHQKTISPPKKLQDAANIIFSEYKTNDIVKDSSKLFNILKERLVPVEEDVKERTKKEIDMTLERKNPIKPYLDLMDEEDKEILSKKRNFLSREIYLRKIYNWKPILYDPYRCVQYLAVRFAPEYAALVRVFQEINIRIPDFKPRSVFDFGSGVGTTTWAVDHIWPGICWETLSYDPSDDMNNLNEILLRGGDIEGKLKRREGGTFFRNYMPHSDRVPYDLVVSAYSLFEVGQLGSRAKVLDTLWRKVAPGGCLVLVEQGSKAGYEMIIQAREYLLHCIKQEKEEGYDGGYLFSPCPHESFCPRYFATTTACSFQVSYFKLNLGDLDSQVANKESMSYVVFRRGIKDPSHDKYKWPRVLKGKAKLTRHVLIPTCKPDGTLEEYCATKGKHSKNCYSLCKAVKSGDLLPINDVPFVDKKDTKDNINEFKYKKDLDET